MTQTHLPRVFFLSMIRSGVNKSIANYTIMENYQTAINGMKDYHKFVTTSSTVFDKVTLAPHVEVAVTKNNINDLEKSILDVFKNSDGTLYDLIKKSDYWGIMHDGISKFTNDYNGVFLRRVNYEPFTVPYCLKEMGAGADLGFKKGGESSLEHHKN